MPSIKLEFRSTPYTRKMKKCVKVDTLKQAAELMRATIRENEYGVSHQCGRCGDVVSDSGELLAVVSYNGRVWKGPYPSEEITGDALVKDLN